MLLDGEDVSQEIRTPEVSQMASKASTLEGSVVGCWFYSGPSGEEEMWWPRVEISARWCFPMLK